MTIEQAFRLRILALSAVTAIAGQRVWVDETPQSPTYPLVLIVNVTDLQGQHLRGPDGVRTARLQTEARVRNIDGTDAKAQAVALSDAVHGNGHGTAASGVFGWIGTIGSPSVRVLNVSADERRTLYDAEERRVVRVVRDYLIRYVM